MALLRALRNLRFERIRESNVWWGVWVRWSEPEPTIPAPPPFARNGDTRTQDSAKARVVMVATEHASRGMQADVTDAWDALLAERERLREALRRVVSNCDDVSECAPADWLVRRDVRRIAHDALSAS